MCWVLLNTPVLFFTKIAFKIYRQHSIKQQLMIQSYLLCIGSFLLLNITQMHNLLTNNFLTVVQALKLWTPAIRVIGSGPNPCFLKAFIFIPIVATHLIINRTCYCVVYFLNWGRWIIDFIRSRSCNQYWFAVFVRS